MPQKEYIAAIAAMSLLSAETIHLINSKTKHSLPKVDAGQYTVVVVVVIGSAGTAVQKYK